MYLNLIIHLPEESKLEIIGEGKITTYFKYDQVKITDRYNKDTYGPKILIETWKTKETTIDADSRQVGSGDVCANEKLNKKQFTDRYGKITNGEPFVVNSERVITQHITHYRSDNGDSCIIL